MQSFFADAHNIVICGDEFSARAKSICSEALDGPLTIARSYARVVPEPASSRSSQDVLNYVGLHYRDSNLQSLSAPLGETPNAVSRLPPQVHGLSGSDWRLTLVGSDGLADVCTVGLIRGLGDGYFTSEPWRTRAASSGFSAPARIIHVPPTVDGERLAFKELLKAGKAPLRIADPYAGSDQLERFGDLLRGSRLLTGAKATERGITPDWLQNNSLDVRILPSLHDRFVTGSRIGVIMGASLNGLGKRHSFLVLIDAQMQQQLEQTFEELWAKGRPIDRND